MSLLSRLAVQAARAYGILSARSTNVSADYLVVAGGGGGSGGGGGGGGFLTSTATLSTLNTYSITVGAGGAISAGGSAQGGDGGNSSISGTGLSTITSTGGGGGGGYTSVGRNGGSGGGGANASTSGGTGTSGQGNNGGTGASNAGGGGGGASAVGANATSSNGGAGGAGTASSISGSSVTYSGGGGGGGSSSGGAGGSGGGGAGNPNTPTGGTANTGGGAGGSYNTSGSNGGSGIVIISYTSATPKFVGGTITTSGGKQIHTFTSSGTLSPVTPITASYLVVAGGAGGGGANTNQGGGGGGAGGLLTNSTTLYSGATYVVTVGAGGTGGVYGGAVAGNGSNSVVSGTGLTTLTAVGGGGGGVGPDTAGISGGSGGGAGSGGVSVAGGTATSGQGNAGGANNGNSPYAGGGGGGAGAVGGAGGSVGNGNGGNGSASSISGTSVTYAGGGGAGKHVNASAAGTGGTGGGGNGGSSSVGVSGTTNLGGGGGGGSSGNVGGAGGSGIVIISYAGSQVFNGGLVTSSGGNTIHTFTSSGALTPLTNNLTNSLRFRSSASAYLNRTPTVAGNRQKFTWSGWVKFGQLATTSTIFSVGATSTVGTYFEISKYSTELINIADGTTDLLRTTQVFRDPSAWYHIVVAVDTTNATADNRVILYVNGSQVTAFNTRNNPTLNANLGVNNTNIHYLGTSQYSGTRANFFDGYMADINFIDGQALEPYYFGNNDANGVWKPIQYKGTYGTNGFYLNFADTSALTTSSNAGLGKDTSGNGNYWTTNNISITSGSTYDAMKDVPTNTSATVANYAVMNPLTYTGTLASGNLELTTLTSYGSSNLGTSTIDMSSGSWYWEVTKTSGSATTLWIGIVNSPTSIVSSSQFMYGSGGTYYESGSTVASGKATYATNDVIGIALNASTKAIEFFKNGVSQGSYTMSLNGPYFATVYDGDGASACVFAFNFGQRPFAYTPPTGFVALNTYNLPTPTILQGNKYMDATLWTGTGSSQVIVNQAQFKPDFVWVKQRSSTENHQLVDTVRGYDKYLNSNLTDAEATNTNRVTSFNSNGFSIGTATSVNSNTNTYVGWQWQAGQGSTSSNTSGSITSTVSVNTTAGFSVVTYTGTGANATVGHGLGVAPKMVIVKQRNTTRSWYVYHGSLASAANYLVLDSTAAAGSDTTLWNNTAPTSSVFSLGANIGGNQSTGTYVAYCWAEIAGFSKFGSYTGNGSTDGPFVYLGFRPKFVMVKIYSGTTGDWAIFDTSRSTYNEEKLVLWPNLSIAESTGSNGIDGLANGFKIRSASNYINGTSSYSYIYMAFTENPFKNANAR